MGTIEREIHATGTQCDFCDIEGPVAALHCPPDLIWICEACTDKAKATFAEVPK